MYEEILIKKKQKLCLEDACPALYFWRLHWDALKPALEGYPGFDASCLKIILRYVIDHVAYSDNFENEQLLQR